MVNSRFMHRLASAFLQPVILFVVLVGNSIMAGCAYLFFLFEQGSNPHVRSYFDALWWAFCTVTTVGFGDVVPMTTEGRIIGMFLMVTGIFFFLSFSSLLVTLAFGDLSRELQKEEAIERQDFDIISRRLDEILLRLDRIEKR